MNTQKDKTKLFRSFEDSVIAYVPLDSDVVYGVCVVAVFKKNGGLKSLLSIPRTKRDRIFRRQHRLGNSEQSNNELLSLLVQNNICTLDCPEAVLLYKDKSLADYCHGEKLYAFYFNDFDTPNPSIVYHEQIWGDEYNLSEADIAAVEEKYISIAPTYTICSADWILEPAMALSNFTSYGCGKYNVKNFFQYLYNLDGLSINFQIQSDIRRFLSSKGYNISPDEVPSALTQMLSLHPWLESSSFYAKDIYINTRLNVSFMLYNFEIHQMRKILGITGDTPGDIIENYLINTHSDELSKISDIRGFKTGIDNFIKIRSTVFSKNYFAQKHSYEYYVYPSMKTSDLSDTLYCGISRDSIGANVSAITNVFSHGACVGILTLDKYNVKHVVYENNKLTIRRVPV